jgi:hypothetical protein
MWWFSWCSNLIEHQQACVCVVAFQDCLTRRAVSSTLLPIGGPWQRASAPTGQLQTLYGLADICS